MKTIRRMLITAMISLSFSAANAFSELNLKMYDNSNLSVTIDNAYMGQGNSVSIPGLLPGNHFLVVNQMIYAGYGHGNGHGHGHGHGKAYGHQKNGKYTMVNVFSGYVYLNPNMRTFAMIDGCRNLVITGQQPICAPVPVVCHTNIDNSQPVYNGGMSLHVFIELKNIIINANFDQSKLSIAQQAIYSNGVNSQQLFELMTLLTFESNRLALAKYSYPYTVDRHNYYVVNKAFSFSSSVNDLNAFIGFL